jgi:hypothetical protein
MTRTPWPAARAAAFVRLWHAGASRDAIAAATGISPGSVATAACLLRQWGHDLPRRRGGPGGPWTAERVRPVVEAIGRGAPEADLAELMDVAPTSVRTTLARLRVEGHAIPCRPSH